MTDPPEPPGETGDQPLGGDPLPSGDNALLEAAETLSWLAGSLGAAEAVQTPADAYPGSTSGQVVYDLGVAFSLALGDLAANVSAVAARSPVAEAAPQPPASSGTGK